MKQNISINIFLILFCFLTSCISSTITSYTDPENNGKKFKRIMVEVKTKDLVLRDILEWNIVKCLRENGVKASPCIEIVSPTKELTKKMKEQMIKKYEIDSWMVVSILSQSTDIYYDSSGVMPGSPGIPTGSTMSPVIKLSTSIKLFDTKNRKCVWISGCNTISNDVFSKSNVKKISTEIVKKLKADKII